MRTSLHLERPGKPVQEVDRQVWVQMEEHDWRGLSVTNRQGRLDAYVQADRSIRGEDLQ